MQFSDQIFEELQQRKRKEKPMSCADVKFDDPSVPILPHHRLNSELFKKTQDLLLTSQS
jgi:hypothetical protein